MLLKLTQKKHLTILGLNSGTSIDSLDLAVVKIDCSTKQFKARYLRGRECKTPKALRTQTSHAADSKAIPFSELMQLDYDLGRFYGQAAKTYCTYLAKQNIKIDAIASHGQTISHLPNKLVYKAKNSSGTMQLGSADMIAAKTNRIVINDFRQADIAVGGEGAPITTGAMALLMNKYTPAVIINIGGMSNYFYLPGSKSKTPIQAADCGPGNILSDLLVRKLYNLPMDKNGGIAASGEISADLLKLLQSSKFFKNRHKSTGREDFGQDLVEKIVSFNRKKKLPKADLVATAAELTLLSIQKEIDNLANKNEKIAKLYLTGGGRKNKLMVRRLKELNSSIEIKLIDSCGVDGDFVEAAAYAVMGAACLRSTSLLKSTIGYDKPVLGKITQPPSYR